LGLPGHDRTPWWLRQPGQSDEYLFMGSHLDHLAGVGLGPAGPDLLTGATVGAGGRTQPTERPSCARPPACRTDLSAVLALL